MPQNGWIVRALIASPSDVQQERQAIPEVITAWNATHSLSRGVIIEPVKWESHSLPGLEGRPQEMINKQLVETCDFLIGVFWTRLGTHTGVAESGSVEEIEEFRKAGKPVLLYFSFRPVEPDSIDSTQYEKLTRFRHEMEQAGLIEKYHDAGEFREKLSRHLTSVIERIQMVGTVPELRIPAEMDPVKESRNRFVEQLEIFCRRLAADWSTERESQPYDVGNAKSMMQVGAKELVEFISHMGDNDYKELIKSTLQEVIKKMKVLERYQIYMDGGNSYKEFWWKGDEIIRDLESAIQLIKTWLL